LLADLDLVSQLDDLRALRTVSDRTDGPARKNALPARYVKAFARYGIHPGTDPAARIRQRPAPIREALVAGLENWWLIAQDRDPAARDWLEAVLRSVDADAWRTQVRRAVVQRDRPRLEELARNCDVNRQPKATVTSLARALLDAEAYDAAIALL